MKKTNPLALAAAVFGMAATAHAAVSITNGTFDAAPAADNSTDITGWHDQDGGNFWEQAWLESVDVPTGPALALAGGGFTGTPWAYQAIGTADGAPVLNVTFDFGSFADAGSNRDFGVTWSVYVITGGFTPAQNTDIHNAGGVLLLDTVSYSLTNLAPGINAGPATVSLDIEGAGAATLYLRVTNFTPTTTDNGNGYGWVDNVSVMAVPEPSGAALLCLSALAMCRRRRG